MSNVYRGPALDSRRCIYLYQVLLYIASSELELVQRIQCRAVLLPRKTAIEDRVIYRLPSGKVLIHETNSVVWPYRLCSPAPDLACAGDEFRSNEMRNDT